MSTIEPSGHGAVEATPRKAMSTRRRMRIADRQGVICARINCGAWLRFGFEVDHIIPLALGGADTDENCEALCLPHHAAKTKKDRRAIAKALRLARDADPATRRQPYRKMRSAGFRKDPLR